MEASTPVKSRFQVAIVSDIHYAGAEERARGHDYESRLISNPLLRAGVWLYRHFIWMRHPLEQAPQLERFLNAAGAADFVVANGDYSCDSGAIGVSDPAALASAQVCVGKLRAQFGERIRFTLGDHELDAARELEAGHRNTRPASVLETQRGQLSPAGRGLAADCFARQQD